MKETSPQKVETLVRNHWSSADVTWILSVSGWYGLNCRVRGEPRSLGTGNLRPS